MNTIFQKALLPALITSTILLSGCGSSSDNNDQVSDSSSTFTSGIITGFGSIYVNGIKFETTDSSFDVDDDTTADQDDLRVGMRIEISGTINDDGLTGTADSISYDNELEGPVSEIDTTTDAPNVLLTILGQQVTVNADTTFDNDDNNLDMNTIQLNDLLEVSGYTSSNGIIATHIEKQQGSFDSNNPDASEIEIKGLIEQDTLTADSFSVKGLNVSFSSTTELDGIPNDTLLEGLLVEVHGNLNDTADLLIATKIEAEDDGQHGDSDEVEIEGLITEYDAIAQTFIIQNQVVNVSNVSEITPSSLVFENDLKVEVEGSISDGTLFADEVKLKGRKIKIHAAVSSTGTETVTFSLFGGTDNITVRVNQQTDMEDDLAQDDVPFSLADLIVGDFVEVEAFDDGTDTINAVELERKESDDFQLEGPVSGFDATAQTITMFGITLTLPADAKYEDEDDVEFNDISDFFNQLTEGTFIELTDEIPDGVNGDLPDGVIDKVEIEEEDDD